MRLRICATTALGLIASACSNLSGMHSILSAEGPPLVDGFYIEPGDQCGEACPTFGKWHASAPSDVYAEPKEGSEVVGHIAMGDWVTTAPGEVHVRPLRGTVEKAGGGLAIDDVVYQLLDDGEGFSYEVWRKGEIVNVEAEADNAPVVHWDDVSTTGQRSIWWVRVELPEKKTGWLRNPADFEGMGPLSSNPPLVRGHRADQDLKLTVQPARAAATTSGMRNMSMSPVFSPAAVRSA